VKVMVPSGTPRTLIPSDGVVNCDGVLKFGCRPEGDLSHKVRSESVHR
jgi:hypothetical protein